MLIVALPSIRDEFDTGLSSAGWLITGYLIAVAALQTPAGKLGDRIGHRRLFLGGLVAFLAMSVGAAAAPNLGLLIALRTGQGVAGAVVFPNGWAMLRRVIPAERRARRFGAVGSAVALAAGTGPPIGGAVIGLSGWRWVFLVNVALVVPALVIGRRCLPVPEPASDPGPTRAAAPGDGAGRRGRARPPFDLVGAAGWLVLLLGATATLNLSVRSGNMAVAVVGAPLVAAFGVWFVRRERAHPDPVLQPRFFAHPAFAAVNIAVGLSNLAMYSILLAVPIVLERHEGGPGPGAVLAALTLLAVTFSPVGGRLADRLGRRTPAIAGMTCAAVGAVPLALLGDGIPVPLLVAGLALAGIGLGLSSPAMQTTALESVRPEDSGAASGVYATSRYLGSIFGSSILAASGNPVGRSMFLMVLVSSALAVVAVSRIPRLDPGSPAVPLADQLAGETSTSTRPPSTRTG